MTTPVHTETCLDCAGVGHHGRALFDWCATCGGKGRVPVPMRSVLEDSADEEADELRRKLAVARKALEAISKILRDGATGRGEYWTARALLREWGVYEGDLSGDHVLAEVARVALEELSKS